MLARLRTFLRGARGHLAGHPERIAIVVGGFAAGLALGAPVSDAAFDYTWKDPSFCDDCHIHDYANESYARSVHAGVTTCHDCHRVPIMHYPRNLYGTAFKDYSEQGSIHTPDVAALLCAECHVEGRADDLSGPMTAAVLEHVVRIDSSPLHRLHLDAEGRVPDPAHGGDPRAATAQPRGEQEGVVCLDCHGGGGKDAHRFSTTRENCLGCHEGIKPEGALAEVECRDCHLAGFVGSSR